MKESRESKAARLALKNMTSDPAKWAPKPTPHPAPAKPAPTKPEVKEEK